jgi:predicted ArsR family transcriptional regulator
VAGNPLEDPIRSVAQLDEPNRRRLYDLVSRASEPVGRDEAGTALGITRELAAFHLDRLVEAGLLSAEYRRRNGRSGPGAGRTAKLYRRSHGDVTVTIPARHYERAAGVMAEALEDLGKRGLAALQPIARERGREEASRMVGTSEIAASDGGPEVQLVDALGRAGYEPEVASDGVIRLRNCPYDALVEEHRDLTCGMSVAWAEGLAEAIAAPVAVEFVPATGRCCVVFRPTPIPGNDPGALRP